VRYVSPATYPLLGARSSARDEANVPPLRQQAFPRLLTAMQIPPTATSPPDHQRCIPDRLERTDAVRDSTHARHYRNHHQPVNPA